MGKSKAGTASSSGQKNLGAKGPVKPVPASRGGPKKTQAEKEERETEFERQSARRQRAKEELEEREKAAKRKGKKEGPSNSELHQAMIAMMSEMKGMQQNMNGMQGGMGM